MGVALSARAGVVGYDFDFKLQVTTVSNNTKLSPALVPCVGVLQALDTVLRWVGNNDPLCISVGRNFYYTQGRNPPLGGGVVAWEGYTQVGGDVGALHTGNLLCFF